MNLYSSASYISVPNFLIIRDSHFRSKEQCQLTWLCMTSKSPCDQSCLSSYKSSSKRGLLYWQLKTEGFQNVTPHCAIAKYKPDSALLSK